MRYAASASFQDRAASTDPSVHGRESYAEESRYFRSVELAPRENRHSRGGNPLLRKLCLARHGASRVTLRSVARRTRTRGPSHPGRTSATSRRRNPRRASVASSDLMQLEALRRK